MFGRSDQPPAHYVSPRVRAYGRARLEVARRAQSGQEWDILWKPPIHDFPFKWGPYWKQCVEFKVDDFAAEVGFFIDILGLPVNAFNPDYVMFTSPNRDFYFAIVPVPAGDESTPPNAIRLQFMVEDVFVLTEELERRGVIFEQYPQPIGERSQQYVACFRTPHGILVDLWGLQTLSHQDQGGVGVLLEGASDDLEELDGDDESEDSYDAHLYKELEAQEDEEAEEEPEVGLDMLREDNRKDFLHLESFPQGKRAPGAFPEVNEPQYIRIDENDKDDDEDMGTEPPSYYHPIPFQLQPKTTSLRTKGER